MFYPEVCGNGKGLVTSLFHQNWDFYTVLFLVIVKLIATSVTFGSGAVGGVFTPTLFFGSAIGVLYGQAVLYFAPQLQPDPNMYGLNGHGLLSRGNNRCAVDGYLDGIRTNAQLCDRSISDGCLRLGLLL